MNRKYYKFTSSEEQGYLMYDLIKSIEIFEMGGGFESKLIDIYESLARYAFQKKCKILNKDRNEVDTFADFLILLSEVPPIEWFEEIVDRKGISNTIWHKDFIEVYNEILQYPLILEDGFLSQEALDFLDDYYSEDKTLDELEQANMRNIINLLRKTDDRYSQFIYSYIRNNVIAINGEINLKTKRPIHSIRDENQYIDFKKEFMKPKYGNDYVLVEEAVDKLFERIDGPSTLVYCAYCGSKMYKVKEEYVCVGRSICKNNLKPGETQALYRNIEVGETIYIPKRGVSRYNVIPGIDELHLIKKLRHNFSDYDFVKIEEYPGKDAEGDVKIIIGERSLVIDVKSWKKSARLMKHIEDNKSQFENKQYVYIPMHLKQEYERGLSGLNTKMKDLGLKAKAVSITELEKDIKREIEKYQLNPEDYIEEEIESIDTKEAYVQMSML